MGVDGVEFDVRLSADGRPVVIHDSRINRTTGERGAVARLTAADLSRLDAASWFDARLRSRPRLRAEVLALRAAHSIENKASDFVPTLEAVLRLLAPSKLKRVYIELKGKARQTNGLLPSVLELVREFRMEQVVTILSFDHPVVQQAGEQGIRSATLFPIGRPASMSTKQIVRRVEQVRAMEAAVHFALATPRLVAALHDRGIAVSAWTVNSKLVMRRLIANEIDAIMTNFPNRLADVLNTPESSRRGGRGFRRRRLRDSLVSGR
jgi:glycerophosphoryl diester phosphodiesterase